ncbi:MAG: hypothetical protein HRT64_12335 [Erythrobacter sp.]|nr:hypothetical protein [Erythrobacter sp.]
MIKHDIKPAKRQVWKGPCNGRYVIIGVCESDEEVALEDIRGSFSIEILGEFLEGYKLWWHQRDHVLEDGYEYSELLDEMIAIDEEWEEVAIGLYRRPVAKPEPKKPTLVEYKVEEIKYGERFGLVLRFVYRGRSRLLDEAPKFASFVGYVFRYPNGEKAIFNSARIYENNGSVDVSMYTEGATALAPVAVAFLEDSE